MKRVSRWCTVALVASLCVAVIAGAIDLYNDSLIEISSPATGKTAGGPGSSVDLRPTTVDSLGTRGNVFRSALFIFNVGAFTDSASSGKYEFSIEESNNDYDYTTVPAGELAGAAPVLDDSTDGSRSYPVQYFGTSRYLRPNWTVTGPPDSNSVAVTFSIMVMLLDPKYRPVR